MLTQFEAFVNKEHLYAQGQQVLLAVSGGRDSVTLCELTARMGQPFAIAHCNFHLRPGDCDRDEAFVRSLAQRYQVPFHLASFDTTRYAQANGLSIEEAARKQRYDFFEEIRVQQGYDCVATAHHRDDAIETFFINLLRGTGIAGLQGIPLRRDHIVRPLLCFSRAQIDRFVEENSLSFVEDYTNAETHFLRNRIRLQLLPLLRQWSPSFDDIMTGNLHHLHDAGLLYRRQVDELRNQLLLPAGDGWRLPFGPLRELPAPHTLLFELLRPFGFSSVVADEVFTALDAQPGACFQSDSFRLVKDRDSLFIFPLGDTAPTTVTLPPDCQELFEPLHLTFRQEPVQELPFKLPPSEACFDAGQLNPPLHLRRWREGDRFQPYGMKGSRLLSDLFSDAKMHRLDKERQWLLCDADDRILWVVGLRASAVAAVTTSTTQMLHITLHSSREG